MIAHLAVAARCPVAERNANADREDQGKDGKFNRCGKTAEELLDNRATGSDRVSEVALQEATHPGEILLVDGAIEAVQGVDSFNGFGGGLLTEKGNGWSAGEGTNPEKQKKAKAKEGGDEEQNPLANSSQHAKLRCCEG